MDKRRVVISGIGLVTPLGLGQSKNWNDLISGESGINSINSFDASDLSCRIGGEISSGPSIEGKLDLNEWLNIKEQRKLGQNVLDYWRKSISPKNSSTKHSALENVE